MLCGIWTAAFIPVTRSEFVLFALASVFFLAQDHVSLRAGLFEFRFKDVLLVPYYEPLLWGFYTMSMKRVIVGRGDQHLPLRPVAFGALLLTSAAFSTYNGSSRILFVVTVGSTAVLLALFHDRDDLSFALVALTIGFVVELFGVSTGLWFYPQPDFWGIPAWFATMWISAGLLVRRFAIPAAEWAVRRA